MSRRVSQRWRKQCSEAIQTSEVETRDVDCAVQIRGGKGPRRLIYRRLRGMENVFNGAWPKKTKIHCWYCRLPFKTTPVPIVQQYDSDKDKYDVYGICCSAQCSKAYIRSLKTNDARARLVWQEKMLTEEFGWPRNKPIPSAGPWQAIDVFGGYKTIEEWRGTSPKLSVKLKVPPFVPFHIYTETEQKGVSVIEETAASSREIDDSVEEQAIQHGASFSLKKLRRPPESEIIRTEEELYAKYPDCVGDGEGDSEPFFQTFLRTQQLPTDEECANIRKMNKEKRKAESVKKKEAKKTKATASPPKAGKSKRPAAKLKGTAPKRPGAKKSTRDLLGLPSSPSLPSDGTSPSDLSEKMVVEPAQTPTF